MRKLFFLIFYVGFATCFAQSPDDILKQASDHYEKDEFRKALHFLNEYMQLDSSSADAYNKRGNCYYSINNLPKALNDYYQAISLDSLFSNPYYNIGSIYSSEENYDSSSVYFKKYVDLEPEDASGFAALGEAILINETIDSALYYFKKAVSIDSTDVFSLSYLSRLSYFNMEFDMAIEYSNKGKRINATIGDFFVVNSLSNYSKGNFEESIIQSDSALLIDSTNVEAIAINIKANVLNVTNPEEIYQTDNLEFKFKNFISNNLQNILNEYNQFDRAELRAKLESGKPIGLDQYFLYFITQQNEADFSPYGFGTNQEIAELWKEEEYEKLTKLSHTIFEKNPLALNEIYKVAVANYISGNLPAYKKYLTLYLGLMESIEATGTGTSADSAYIVTSTSDEYALLFYQNMKSGGQALINDKGHSFDVLTATDEMGETKKVYFNVDIPLGSLARSFRDTENKKDNKKKKRRKKKRNE